MTQHRKDQLHIAQAIVAIITMPLLTGIGGWCLLKTVQHAERIAVIESKMEVQTVEVHREFRSVFRVLEDHELRIRTSGN